MKKLNRRNAIKKLAVGIGAMPFFTSSLSGSSQPSIDPAYFDFKNRTRQSFDTPVTAITLGAGNRGNVYGNYAIEYPGELNIVGVAEPIPIRNERYAQKHAIADKHRFVTWEHVFEQPKFADAIIISTPDDLHYGPCMQALKMGYDVLLEKPIAPTAGECRDILALAKETGRIVAVCHVLRYTPYFKMLKEVIDSGVIGDLISVQHFEPIQHVHMAHSFVRGNWHDAKATTPIILAKSCHDLDILRWLIGQSCKTIAAFGNLSWFNETNAPAESPHRCTDGCPVESTCPYSALKIYYRDRSYTYVFDFPEDESTHAEFILEQLRTTNYGRCVYRMENDQPDHYVTSMEFDGNITANFSMEAFTSYHGRRTRIMGSLGDIVGDMKHFVHTDFLSMKSTKWDISMVADDRFASSGHGGGDWALVSDWLLAIKLQDAGLLTSTIDASIESHLMGFMAEQSRLTKQTAQVNL